MDARLDDMFSGLRSKIKSVISLYEAQKAKTTELRKINIDLTQKVDILENKLDELEKKIDHLKFAKVLSSMPGEDIHQTKIQVNRIVREIDKCIALLNR
jgi:DNA-binding transcriptional MerR regulator